jgi:hypothetical protein
MKFSAISDQLSVNRLLYTLVILGDLFLPRYGIR